jgi:hypothetical protein
MRMPATERKAIYASLVSQLASQTINEAFRADVHGVVGTIVLNGHVRTLDKRTGQEIHPCLVTVRTTRDRFCKLNLGQVDPAKCLKGLNVLGATLNQHRMTLTASMTSKALVPTLCVTARRRQRRSSSLRGGRSTLTAPSRRRIGHVRGPGGLRLRTPSSSNGLAVAR